MNALAYLDSFLNYEQITAYRYPGSFSLDRVERLMDRLGSPHRRVRVLHVAGTKGKGSTCAFAAAILRAAGLKTGLYTSPHLTSFRERIQVDGRMISERELAEAVERLKAAADGEITYFEAVTACAFLHFERAGVEAAVVEVGMGGRLDATNVVAPAVTAVTPISLDHMPKLGATLSAIALEKAGILKAGVPAVIAPQPPEAMEVIREVGARVGAPLHPLEREVRIEAERLSVSGSRASFTTPAGRHEAVEVPLMGRHQLANAAVAIRLAELFFESARSRAVREGIAATRWPGRCQVIPGAPPVLLDGAQNAESACALVETVRELFPGREVTLVVGVSQEKDLEGMARLWGPWARRIFLTEAPVPRAEPVARLQAVFARFHPSPMETGSAPEMLERALKAAGPGGLVVAAGSLFVAAEGLRFFKLTALPEQEEAGSEQGRQQRDQGVDQREGERLLR